MKVAFVYDRVNKFGGAERVLMALHEIWPDAPLFTSVYNLDGAPWANSWDVQTSFLQHIPGAKNNHEMFGWLMPFAFESLDLSGFDVIISVTSEAAKGIITNTRQLHVCYLLTPTRYLWSHDEKYLILLNRFVRPAAFVAQVFLRQWDFIAAQRPDQVIAISKLAQERCRKYYRRETEVIYPPMQLNSKRSDLSVRQGRTLSERTHYLVVSRLVPYKRVDLAIHACNQLKFPLVIVGTGSDGPRLKSLAGPTIKFAGYLTDEELVQYYKGSKALLMPQEEDFGLVGLEALAYGVPVISYKKSGIAEIIEESKTGILFEEQSVTSLSKVLQQLEVYETSNSWKFRKQEIELNRQRFSAEAFKEKFRSTIEKLWKAHH